MYKSIQSSTPSCIELELEPDVKEQLSRRMAARLCDAPGCSNTESEGTKFQKCSGCKARIFCSKECQKAAWKGGHKGECTKLAELQARLNEQQQKQKKMNRANKRLQKELKENTG